MLQMNEDIGQIYSSKYAVNDRFKARVSIFQGVVTVYDGFSCRGKNLCQLFTRE